MANNTKKSGSTTKSPAKKEVLKDIGSKEVENVEEKFETPKKIVPREIDNEQLIVVKNGFQGRLVYVSRRTGETFIWDSFGAEQEIELRELKSAKNTFKKYFANNWFMFDESWVIDYLGVKQYYKNAISISDFDNIFTKSPDELKDIISKLSPGQKKSVAYRAKQLINEEIIDSRKVINALEDALSIELIEK